MIERPPNRLRDDPRLGSAIVELAGNDLSPARLERNRVALRQRLATPPRRFWLARRWAVAVAVLLATPAIATASFYVYKKVIAPEKPIIEEPHPRPRRSLAEAPAAEPVVSEPEDTPPERAKRAKKKRFRRPHVTPQPVEPGVAPPDTEPDVPLTPPDGDLDEQLTVYRAAKRAGQSGNPRRGLALLDELITRFPDTLLGAEVALARAELLVADKQYQRATREIETMLDDPRHRGKKAELLSLLGDTWLHLGDCQRATRAFQRALALGLPDEEAANVQRALATCAQQQP